MNQMDKETYLRILSRKLNGIDEEEKEDAICYVREYFEEAGVENEKTVIEELGSPSKFAATIKANTASKDLKEDHEKISRYPHSNMKKIITVFLGICAMPIALPLLMALILVGFAFFLVIFAFGLVVVSGIGALFIAGIPMLIKGFTTFETPANALISAGGGLIVIGLGIFLAMGGYQLIRVSIPFAAGLVTKLYEKIKPNRGMQNNKEEREV